MARKVKFALEMADGTKVRSNIEELREHFDMESIISHYLSGKLLEWLEDRYYDDEAIKIADLDKNAPNLNAQLCAIIGVDASEFDALDTEAVERLNEKKAILQQKTSDETIIANAGITALTQEDLADLLDLESPVIYLCGEKFNIPIRVEHKKYVGILGTPKVEIRATSDTDLKEKDILFENVVLPWSKQTISTNNKMLPENAVNMIAHEKSSFNQELFELWNTAASGRINHYKQFASIKAIWEVIEDNGHPFNRDEFNSGKIKIALSTVCNKQYSEKDVVKALVADDFSSACIFTRDAVCLYDKNKLAVCIKEGKDIFAKCKYSSVNNYIIRYDVIEDIEDLSEALIIHTKDNKDIFTPFTDKYPGSMEWCSSLGVNRLMSHASARTTNSVWKLAKEICNFLNVVKNI